MLTGRGERRSICTRTTFFPDGGGARQYGDLRRRQRSTDGIRESNTLLLRLSSGWAYGAVRECERRGVRAQNKTKTRCTAGAATTPGRSASNSPPSISWSSSPYKNVNTKQCGHQNRGRGPYSL